MKDTYSITKTVMSLEEERSLLLNATIVFDTNILLNFYKYSSKTCKDACDTIETIKDRLFLPYQVGLEYYNNRERIIREQKDLAHNLKKEIDNCFDVKLNLIEQSDFYSIIQEHRRKIKEEIDEKNKERPQFEPDNIRQFWEKMYEGKTSPEPSIQEKIDLCSNFQKRYELGIPPGFKDESKKHNLYGDVFIWLDILEYAKKEKKDIIFVSEDIKSDWIKDGSLKIELIKEFQSETGQKIKHYTFETFLKSIVKEQKIKLSKTTKTELKSFASTFQQMQKNHQIYEKLNNINNKLNFINQNSSFIKSINQQQELLNKLSSIQIPNINLAQINALTRSIQIGEQINSIYEEFKLNDTIIVSKDTIDAIHKSIKNDKDD